jgi:hypothetical protein
MVHLRELDQEGADRSNKSYLDIVCCQDEIAREVYDFRAKVIKENSVDQPQPDLERRVADIQQQVERLSAAVEHPAEHREQAALMESRLTALTQQCAEILDRWTLTDLRHTRALGEMEARLNNWERLETRVEEDAHQRLGELERKIEQEWVALRQILEQPVKQLQEHAASLRETSVATAGSALTGLERAETRLTTIQADLADRMNVLTREVQSVMAELRGVPGRVGPPRQGSVQSWPLDQVMRLHNELRDDPDRHEDADGMPEQLPLQVFRPQNDVVPLLPEAAASLADRIQTVEKAMSSGKENVRKSLERAERERRSVWRIAAALVAIALVSAAAFALYMERRMSEASAQINAAQEEAAAARTQADKQIAASRSDAERQIAEARKTAMRAQIVSEVLVASDLVRYGLAGGEMAPAARGQLLWSRSRGLVLSGSRVPPPPVGSTYQLWLMTSTGPVSAAFAKPDPEGRISLATDAVPAVPRPVIGIALTVEPNSGSPMPTGGTALSYQPQ